MSAMVRWGLVLGAMALSAGGASGCFFDTRDPEVAEQIDTMATRWRQPSTQDILTNNVRVTFEDQQIDFYRRSFRDDFAFHPDNVDSDMFAQQSQFPFTGYDEVVEEQVAEIIFNTTDDIKLEFSNLDPPVYELGVDSLRTQLNYELVLIDSLPLEGGGLDTTLYKGILTFIMRLDAGEWGLQSWEDDRSGEPIDTWGLLRGRTRP